MSYHNTIHTALLGIGRDGADIIPLADGLSLVRPNDRLLAHRWDEVQGLGEMKEEAQASRYLVCEYPQWIEGRSFEEVREFETNRFYSGLMAIQILKPIRTLGFVYRHQQIERRPPMEPGSWALSNKFDDAMLASLPALIHRISLVMEGQNPQQKNALILLQLGLEHFHPYIAGLLWVTGLEAIFDSGGRGSQKEAVRLPWSADACVPELAFKA